MVKLLAWGFTLLGMAVTAAMTMLTVADVFMRWALGRPITGTVEITEFIMVCLLIGLAPCALEGRHISVDVIVRRLPPKGREIIEAGNLLVGSALVVVMAWQGFMSGLDALHRDLRSSMVSIPVFPFYIVLSLGFASLFLAMVYLFVRIIRKETTA
jgi:TRAP-type C4-dicarboxylate transport system permease small subunit